MHTKNRVLKNFGGAIVTDFDALTDEIIGAKISTTTKY